MPSTLINDKLAALTARFKQRLSDTHKHISQWKNADHIKELIEIAHKLAGTAGTYGFPVLSAEMKELELYLLKISDEKITDEQALDLYKKAQNLLNDALQID